MAEWFKRSTVNTFYKGSSPFKSLQYCKKLNLIKNRIFFTVI